MPVFDGITIDASADTSGQQIDLESDSLSSLGLAHIVGSDYNDVLIGESVFSTINGVPINISEELLDVTYLRTGDIDGDGDLDVVIYDELNDRFQWHIYDSATDTFGSANTINFGSTGNLNQRFELADINGDGKMDIVVGEYSTGSILKFSYDGGTFTSPTELISDSATTGVGIVGIDVADIDNDGDMDIVISDVDATSDDASVMVFFNNGGTSPTFTSVTLESDDSNSTVDDVEFVDIDGDGDLDVVRTSEVASNGVAWFENLGGEEFSSRNVIDTGAAFEFTAGDIDLDGDIDIIAVQADGVKLYTNAGNGSFTESVLTADVVAPLDMADYDQDGDIDLLTSNTTAYGDTSQGKYTLYDNNGSQSFSKGTFNVIGSSNGAEFVDLDEDGILDIIGGSGEKGAAFYYEGDGTFTNLEDNSISGGEGNDSIDGGFGTDTLVGGNGNDLIVFRSDSSTYNGGADTDTLTAYQDLNNNFIHVDGINIDLSDAGTTISNFEIIQGSIGNDVIVGATTAESLFGNEGNDILNGSGGADTVYGGDGQDIVQDGAGTDTVFGGNGSDILYVTDDSDIDTFFGGDGFDVVDYSAQDSGVTFDLRTQNASGLSQDNNNDFFDVASIEKYIGSSSADNMTGSDDTKDIFEGGDSADFLYGQAESDTLLGQDGADKVYGGSGDDSLFGGKGADSLYGGDGADTLDGGEEASVIDSFYGGSGDDVIIFDVNSLGGSDNIQDIIDGGSTSETNGDTLDASGETVDLTVDLSASTGVTNIENFVFGSGDDTIDASNTGSRIFGGSGLDIISGGSGIDVLFGGIDNDTLDAKGGADTIYGGAGSDTISDNSGADSYFGGSGSDLFTMTNDTSEVDTIDGDGGSDTIDYTNVSSGGITVDMNTITDGYNSVIVSGTTLDKITGIENIVGTSNADTMTGDGQSNSFYGGSNNDTLYGGSGTDYLDGGAGADTLRGGGSSDTIYGGTEDDVILYLDEDDPTGLTSLTNIFGGAGSDTIDASGSSTSGVSFSMTSLADEIEIVKGSNFADIIINHQYTTTIYGNDGDDQIIGGNGTEVDDLDVLYGGENNDQIAGGAGVDTIHGEEDDDLIYDYGSGGTTAGGTSFEADNNSVDSLFGGEGNDTFFSDTTTDNDLLFGGEESSDVSYDIVDYSITSDAVTIDFTAGTIVAVANGSTIDTLSQFEGAVGGSGNDIFTANSDDAYALYGGGGDDTLVGNSQADTLSGGEGADKLTGGDGADTIYGGTGVDSIDGGTGADTIDGGAGLDTITGGDGDDVIIYHADQVNSTDNTLYEISSSGGINAGSGSETNGDTLDATSETGSVTLVYDSDTPDIEVIRGGSAGDNFSITVDSVQVKLYGEAGNDILTGDTDSTTADIFYGGENDDTLSGNQGSDSLYGDGGDDSLDGGDGADTLTGGAGDDTFTGGAGADTMYGGADDDVFISAATNTDADTIQGGDGIDTIDYSLITGSSITIDLAEGSADATMTGAGGDIIREIENILGTNYDGSGTDDVLTGNTDTNVIMGMIGDDTLDGDGGVDTLYGGDDDDLLKGGEGADSLYGGEGIDSLQGDNGDDTMDGGTGVDKYSGGAGDDVVLFSTTDYVGTSNTMNVIYSIDGGSTTEVNGDTLDASSETSDLNFMLDDTTVIDLEVINLGTGSDTFSGDEEANIIRGELDSVVDEGGDAHEDILLGGGGADTIYGGVGDDTLVGEGGSDTLYGGDMGNDVFYNYAVTINGISYETGNDAADTYYGGNSDADVFHMGEDISFSESATVLTGASNGAHFVDFDGDGNLDVVGATGTAGGEIVYYKGDGSDISSTATVIATGLGEISYVKAADVNGDGYMDIAAIDATNDDFIYMENDGAGGYVIDTYSFFSGLISGDPRFDLVDVTSDGNLDLLMPLTSEEGGDNVLALFVYDSDLSTLDFTNVIFNPLGGSTTGDGHINVVLGDADNDGYYEYIIMDASGTQAIGYTDNELEVKQVLQSNSAGDNSWDSAQFINIDSDPYLEIITGDPTGDSLYYFDFNSSTGLYNTTPIVLESGNATYEVLVADMNGDGVDDILATQANGVNLYLMDGLGGIAETYNLSASVYQVLDVADFDKDGDLDVLVSDNSATYGSNDGSYKFLINNSTADTNADIIVGGYDGAYDTMTKSDAFNGATQGAQFADVTGDGKLDIIGGTGTAGEIIYYTNDGAGGFSSTATVVTSSLDKVGYIQAGDLDGDGDIDLVAVDTDASGDGDYHYYLNDGSGSFTAGVIDASISEDIHFRLVDLDGDGDLDIVGVDPTGNGAVTFSENRLDESTADFADFTDLIDAPIDFGIGKGEGLIDIDVKDMDGDGDLDIVLSDAGFGGAPAEQALAVLTNDGDMSFEAEENIIDTSSSTTANIWDSAKFVDMDSDGDLDVVSVDNSQSLGWYELKADGSFSTTMNAIDSVVGSSGGVTTEVFAYDMNGDGVDDIIASQATGLNLYFMDGLGSVVFNVSLSTDNLQVLDVADYNGDLKLDILVSDATGAYGAMNGNYYVLKNVSTGDGTDNDTVDYSGTTSNLTINLSDAVAEVYGAGNDQLIEIENVIAGSGDDNIIGNRENNTLDGGGGSDILSGADGDDYFMMTSNDDGLDVLNGGNGTDTADYSNERDGLVIDFSETSSNGYMTIYGSGSDSTNGDVAISIENIIASGSSDTIQSYTDANYIQSGEGDDVLIDGGSNSDSFYTDQDFISTQSGDGNFWRDNSSDTFDAGGGDDTIYMGDSRLANEYIIAKLDEAYPGLYGLIEQGFFTIDLQSLINEEILGDSVNDGLTSGISNTVYGGSGNDYFYMGNDTLQADTIDGGADIDTVDYTEQSSGINVTLNTSTAAAVSETGGDVLINVENVYGSTMDDYIAGDSSVNILKGNEGDDILEGGDGADTLYGGTGSDDLRGGDGSDSLEGGAGEDSLSGDGGDDSLDGGGGDDVIYGGSGSDTIVGGDGADTLVGGDGTIDSLYGGVGNDAVYGEGGIDSISGGSGSDHLYGGALGDTLLGDEGQDYLYGGDGGDVLSGGTDTLGSDGEYDFLYGGSGDDRLIYDAYDFNYFIDNTLFTAAVVTITHEMYAVRGATATDTYTLEHMTETPRGSYFVYEAPYQGGSGTDTLDASSSGDSLFFSFDFEYVNGVEKFIGSAQDDVLDGSSSNDIFDAGGGADLVYGDGGADTINGQAGNDTVLGESGNDTIDGGADADLLFGGSGNDILYGGSDGNDTLYGGDGSDSLNGGTNDDLIYGGDGKDYLYFDNKIDGDGDTYFGGDDYDVLRVGADATIGSYFDFTNSSVSNKFYGIEVFDFNNGTAETITLNMQAIQDIATGSDTLAVGATDVFQKIYFVFDSTDMLLFDVDNTAVVDPKIGGISVNTELFDLGYSGVWFDYYAQDTDGNNYGGFSVLGNGFPTGTSNIDII